MTSLIYTAGVFLFIFMFATLTPGSNSDKKTSKKKNTKTPNVRRRTLKKGKFYWHRDSSYKGKHPSMIYKKNERKNKYYAVCFTHKGRKDRIELNKNINPKDKDHCYVLKEPVLEKREKFGQEIKNYKISNATDKAIVRNIQKKK